MRELVAVAAEREAAAGTKPDRPIIGHAHAGRPETGLAYLCRFFAKEAERTAVTARHFALDNKPLARDLPLR